jgi:Zn-dependent peptidase ImmA (M78 family)
MAVYQKLAGDTATFAVRLGFDRDPDEGTSATQEESASWGQLQLWVEGRNLCSHFEAEEHTDSVHWYMLPFLEWLASNWDFLLHEERLPHQPLGPDAWLSLCEARSRTAAEEKAEEYSYEWVQRHGLIAAREGGLFPDVIIRRFRNLIEISWGCAELVGAAPHFRFDVGEDRAYLEPEAVARPLYEVIEDAVRHLRQRMPDSARLRFLEGRVRALDTPERRASRLALLAGLGHRVEEMEQRWCRIEDRIRATRPEAAGAILAAGDGGLVVSGSCDAALMFGSVSPVLGESDVLRLADVLVECYSPSGECGRLAELVRENPVYRISQPWQEGYGLAESFLERFPRELQDRDFLDVEPLVESLGIDRGEIRLNDRQIRAVSLAGPHHRATTLLNSNHKTNQYDSGRRFSVAHELCHLLYDRAYGSEVAIASGPWAPLGVEKRANAFAAMLLMPRELLDRAQAGLRGSWDTPEGIGQMARRLRVSYTSLIRHLHNLERLDEGAMDALMEQAGRQFADGP